MDPTLSALLGTGLGFLLKAVYDYFKYKSERYDKYYFALLNKRFEIYQEANFYTEKLKEVVHPKNDDVKNKIVDSSQEWFYKNNLYLSPQVRELFQKLIKKVNNYSANLTEKKIKDLNGENTETDKIELLEDWKFIQKKIQEELYGDIDKYYKFINN